MSTFFLHRDGASHGPYDERTLLNWIGWCEIYESDQIWQDDKWVSARSWALLRLGRSVIMRDGMPESVKVSTSEDAALIASFGIPAPLWGPRAEKMASLLRGKRTLSGRRKNASDYPQCVRDVWDWNNSASAYGPYKRITLEEAELLVDWADLVKPGWRRLADGDYKDRFESPNYINPVLDLIPEVLPHRVKKRWVF